MSHISQFFSTYPDFTVDQDATPTAEFSRLKQQKHWEDRDEDYIEASEGFADALAEDFNAAYGTDIDNIEHWQALCHVLRIDPVPEEISACRKAVKSRHVNLVDLVHHKDKIKVFPSIRALRRYSKKHDKIFPKESAKAGGILRYLLRPIFGGS